MIKDDIIQELKDTFDGTPWYGESVMRSLSRLSAEDANARVPGSNHTIVQLIHHMISWRIFAIEKLKGNESFNIKINSEADWKAHADVDEPGLKQLISAFEKSQSDLVALIESFDETDLDKIVTGWKFDFEHLLRGVIYHDIYHQGQINVLRAARKNLRQ